MGPRDKSELVMSLQVKKVANSRAWEKRSHSRKLSNAKVAYLYTRYVDFGRTKIVLPSFDLRSLRML